jgi:hypothetical protein
MVYTVQPRFTNLIRSWRPFVNRNVRKPKLTYLTCNWHSRVDTVSLPSVASLRVRNPRHRSSSENFFARKICSWTELFVNRGVREPRFNCTHHNHSTMSEFHTITMISNAIGTDQKPVKTNQEQSRGNLTSITSKAQPNTYNIEQRFPNFFQVGTTFISQNVLRTALLFSPLKANCLRFSTTVCDTQFTLILFFLSFFWTIVQSKRTTRAEPEDHLWSADHSLGNAALGIRTVCFFGTLLVHMLNCKVSENNSIDLHHSENPTSYLYNVTIILVHFLPYVSYRITATWTPTHSSWMCLWIVVDLHTYHASRHSGMSIGKVCCPWWMQ